MASICAPSSGQPSAAQIPASNARNTGSGKPSGKAAPAERTRRSTFNAASCVTLRRRSHSLPAAASSSSACSTSRRKLTFLVRKTSNRMARSSLSRFALATCSRADRRCESMRSNLPEHARCHCCTQDSSSPRKSCCSSLTFLRRSASSRLSMSTWPRNMICTCTSASRFLWAARPSAAPRSSSSRARSCTSRSLASTSRRWACVVATSKDTAWFLSLN
mmetsp:Transcript_81305/g.226365  ORF Transcript_81305/g.226365 Transcript_81305/m.226365 type:complete len:219 (+) Transcript_81305:1328-1984(+)